MAYDLVIKNGRVIDGSGMPAFHGDVAITKGKIVAVGKLRGSASRTIDADGLVVAPGFIDNHCHYDAQVTWDPLCTFSCYHGATSVIIGNCSLALAPVRRGREARLAEFLSYVEAIPMEVLSTVNMTWETIGEYMNTLDTRLGVNVGNLIGHSAVRYYVMGDDCQGHAATPDEIEAMRGIVREGMTAGALGLSVSKNPCATPCTTRRPRRKRVPPVVSPLSGQGEGSHGPCQPCCPHVALPSVADHRSSSIKPYGQH